MINSIIWQKLHYITKKNRNKGLYIQSLKELSQSIQIRQ